MVITDLERMGDYAKGIARICELVGPEPHVKPLIDIPRMADLSVGMLHRAVEAFVVADAEVARQIPIQDDEVDALYNQVYRELVTLILANPSIIDRANYLIWAAHNLERMADRVTNIGERTSHAATGELRELPISDYAPVPVGEWVLAQVAIPSFAHPVRAGSSLRVQVSSPGRDHGTWQFEEPAYDGVPVVHLGRGGGDASGVRLAPVRGVAVPSGVVG